MCKWVGWAGFLRLLGTSKKPVRLWLPQCGNLSPSRRVLSRLFDLLLLVSLVAHSSLQPFPSLLPCMHKSLHVRRTWRRFCHTAGPAVSIFISCVRGLSVVAPSGFPGHLLPFGLAACFYFLTHTIFCLIGCHLWKWNGEIRSRLVYQSQLLLLSWGKNIKETVAYKMFRMCLWSFSTLVYFFPPIQILAVESGLLIFKEELKYHVSFCAGNQNSAYIFRKRHWRTQSD